MILMMMLRETGVWGYSLVACLPMGLAVAVVVGGALIAGTRVPPVLATAALAIPGALAILASGCGITMALDGMARAAPEQKQALLAMGISQVMFSHVLPALVIVLPAALLLLLAAIAGAVRGPRRMGAPIVAGLLTLVLVAVPVVQGVLVGDLVPGLIRGGLYLVPGLLVAVALLGASRETSGPTAGATAALALPILIGTVEVATRAMWQIRSFEAVAHAAADSKSDLLLGSLAVLDRALPLTWVALLAASLVAVVGVMGSLEKDTHNGGVLLALAGLFVAPMLLWSEVDWLFTMLATQFG